MNRSIISALLLSLSLISCDSDTVGAPSDNPSDTTEDTTANTNNSGDVNSWDDTSASTGGVASSNYVPRSELSSNPILKRFDKDGNLNEDFLYIADPAAEVYDGYVYVYCSRDVDRATNYSTMQDYVIIRSKDLKTWENYGVVLEPRTAEGFEYASGQMNAPDAALSPVDGMYYWYFPAEKDKIGVAKSETPWGPWVSAVDGYITHLFDPTVFVDDDGQVYLFGNSGPNNGKFEGSVTMTTSRIYGVKLKDNMVELETNDKGVQDWKMVSTDGSLAEGVHIFKRKDKYYFTGRTTNWATGYWMSDSPLGPAKYMGEIISDRRRAGGSDVDKDGDAAPPHNSVIEFNNQWYIFYHRGDVNDGNGSRRSACFDELHFNDDGTIIPFNDIQYGSDGTTILSTPYTVDATAGNDWIEDYIL